MFRCREYQSTWHFVLFFLFTFSFHLPLESVPSLVETEAGSKLCDLQHWVHGRFEKNVFIPQTMSTKARLNIPNKKEGILVKARYHWFDKSDSQQCLRDTTLWVIGDSYMRHLYVGVMDVLRGIVKNPSDSGMRDRKRPEQQANLPFISEGFDQMRMAYLENTNITIYFIGRKNFGLGLHLESLKTLLTYAMKNGDAIVLNVLIHDNKEYRVQSRDFRGNMGAAKSYYLKKVSELSEWWQDQNSETKFVWCTSTSYKESKVPKRYQRYQKNKRILAINAEARNYWINKGFPVLDVFHITAACKASSCTADGSHFNRMVNRAKAQVLMNYLCRPSSCSQ